ncbi:hypothetical protein B0H11DRAFT_2034470 [Mycena galericulata]|nr:hypothetical protein B0H11DRAFT_2034470 [Mycena galericulata]
MSRAIPPHWAQPSKIAHKIAQATHENALIPKSSPRLGRKGFLYLQKTAQTVKPEERLRITARRMLKSERDERMDVTHVLTPVKQYMGGFTRGAYSPVEEAYQSHTVFMLESRYNIRYGLGRVDAPAYDFPAILKKYNSLYPPDRSVLGIMDNARWPGGSQAASRKPVKWWTDDAELKSTMAEIGTEPPASEDFEEDDDDLETKQTSKNKNNKKPHRVTALNPTRPSPSIPPSTDLSSPTAPASIRTFHSSSILLINHSYNDDNIIPDFYIRHKRGNSNQDKGDEKTDERQKLPDTPSLMDHLSEAILSDELVASTHRLASKIPTELTDANGVLVHPSGFVIPTPSDHAASDRRQRERDPAEQTAAVAERVLEEDFTDVSAETSSRRGKVPFEVRREDGTVSHPSGFEPPTATDDFEHSGNSTIDSHMGQQPLVLGTGVKRGLHTTASVRAQEVEWDMERARAQMHGVFIPREEYMATLSEKPFWRPLLTFTVSTRPIGLSLLRLSKGEAMGTPFHAGLSNDDRKCRISYIHRMRSLRIRRMQNLAVNMAQVLAGARGGIVGIRFTPDDMGRGIGGEGLENPFQLKELFLARGKEEVPYAGEQGAFDVFDVDDFGQRISSRTGEVVPWKAAAETSVDKWVREPWYKEYSVLHKCMKRFRFYSQTVTAEAAGTLSHINPKKKRTPVVVAPKNTAASAELEEDDGDEEELAIAEDAIDIDNDNAPKDYSPSTIGYPIVRIRDKPNALQELTRSLDDEFGGDDLHELDAPPDFLLTKPQGEYLLGPPDAEEMTLELKPSLARRVVQRRLEMYYRGKEKELASILAAQHNNIDYLNPIWATVMKEVNLD